MENSQTRDISPVPLCPSAPNSADALLIGQFEVDGRFRYITEKQGIELPDLRSSKITHNPKQRFAAKCVESKCKQWIRGRC